MRRTRYVWTSWLCAGAMVCGCTGLLQTEPSDDRAAASVDASPEDDGHDGTDGGTDASETIDASPRPDAGDDGDPVGADGSPTGSEDAGLAGWDARTPVDGPERSPSPFLPARTLRPIAGGSALVYNPHRDLPFAHKGSGHTHCAPDHSGIAADTQESRLRDLPGDHAHDFVWMTAHQLVAEDPGVGGLLHMYGAEIYTGELPSGGTPHVIALLPDDALAGRSDPFGGRYQPFDVTLQAVEDQGGLPTLAHPSRYSPSTAEVVEQDDHLWGIEMVSGGTDPADNAPYIDARLSAGRYVCLSAGGDVHDEEWSLTRGYHMVASENESPTRAGVFEQVRSCNFFACRTLDEDDVPFDDPTVTVRDGEIVFSAAHAVDVDFIGDGGAVLSSSGGETTARYGPTGDETYVRIHARNSSGGECFSQPLWLYRP